MSETKDKAGPITLVGLRGSYLKLDKPQAVKAEPEGKKRYGGVFMIPKGTDAGKAAKAKFDAEIERVKKANPKVKFKSKDICLKDGDTDEDADDNYKGHWFFAANRNEDQKAPKVLDKKKQPIKSDDDQFPYSGCWVNVVVGVYKPKGWDKICASLEIVQFAKNDTPFAGVNASADDLPEMDDDEDDNLDDDEPDLGDED